MKCEISGMYVREQTTDIQTGEQKIVYGEFYLVVVPIG